MSHELQLVGHPFQSGSRAVDVTLETVICLAEGGESYARHQALGSRLWLFADVHHDARPGAVSHLAAAFLETHLTGQCSVAVAEYTRNGNRTGEQSFTCGLAVGGVAGAHVGHHAAWDVEQLQQVVVPLHGVDVEQHGSRGIGEVSGMHLAAGEFPDEPRLDGTHEQFASRA